MKRFNIPTLMFHEYVDKAILLRGSHDLNLPILSWMLTMMAKIISLSYTSVWWTIIMGMLPRCGNS